MKRRELSISVAIHAALVVALAVCHTVAPTPDECVRLDLADIELSWAETIDDVCETVEETPPKQEPPPQVPPPQEPRETMEESRRAVEEPPPPQEPPPQEPREKVKETHEAVEEPPPPQPPPTSEAVAPSAQAAAAPRQAQVDAPPKPRCAIRPDYPRTARRRGEQGDVTLELDVAADGAVGDVRVIRSPGFPLLEEAAVKAIRAARFTPAMAGGSPVASTARMTLAFKLK